MAKTDKLHALFADYLGELRKTPVANATEHTFRSPFEHLLSAFAQRAEGNLHVQHEPKRSADKGAPDFKITKSEMLVGYVETKRIGANLDQLLKSDQISKYKTLSQNIVLTDYCEFVWINRYGPPKRATLLTRDDLKNRKHSLRDDRVEAITTLLDGFLTTPPEGIDDSKTLALALAKHAHVLRDGLTVELVRQERENQGERLFGLYDIFKKQIFHELTAKEFADAFAQTLVYGLFLARLNVKPNTKITLQNARQYVPGSFRLIRELVSFLDELEKDEYVDIRWVIEETLLIINGFDVRAIHEYLSFRHRPAISRHVRAADEEEHRLFERDPFIYFYEDFLKAYDPAMRKSRGVYYTPPPVVNFIVRAVDDILKESFGIREGLADNERVTVLDFACGTGTFLLEVFQQIFENIGGADLGSADLIVRDHILKNLYGFEYLIAPYTIAHLKLSQYLSDKGHALKANERLQVFLTNTLEPIEPQKHLLLPAVTAEVEAAQTVKDKPILVITGNPPYQGVSKNMGTAAKQLVERYRFVDGKPLKERKQWLQDDYVKFVAFAQKKIDMSDNGIVGVITNHSWIDNPTYRGMRKSLMETFEHLRSRLARKREEERTYSRRL